jgi:hypothetical protein
VAQRLKVAASALGDLTLRDHERFYRREAEFSSLEHFETFAPALMLYGLALENLAKGLVVAGRMAAENDMLTEEELGKSVFKHRTEELLDHARFELSQGDRDLLKRLHVFAVSAGRYPTPRFSRGLHQAVQLTALLPTRAEFEQIDRLFDRLGIAIVKTPQRGPAKAKGPAE